MDAASVPPAARWLEFAGLIPFLALSLSGGLGPDVWREDAKAYLLGYAIAILSFMGGAHWGLAVAWSERRVSSAANIAFAVSVLPALAGWLALFLPAPVQLIWLAACFSALLAYDMTFARKAGAPKWYAKLRLPLTVVVVGCLLFATVTGFPP